MLGELFYFYLVHSDTFLSAHTALRKVAMIPNSAIFVLILCAHTREDKLISTIVHHQITIECILFIGKNKK